MCCYRSLVFSCWFLDPCVLQGSVATHLRCGRIFTDSITTNVLLILTVKKLENWSIFDEVIRRTKIVQFFGSPCTLCTLRTEDAIGRIETASLGTRVKSNILQQQDGKISWYFVWKKNHRKVSAFWQKSENITTSSHCLTRLTVSERGVSFVINSQHDKLVRNDNLSNKGRLHECHWYLGDNLDHFASRISLSHLKSHFACVLRIKLGNM